MAKNKQIPIGQSAVSTVFARSLICLFTVVLTIVITQSCRNPEFVRDLEQILSFFVFSVFSPKAYICAMLVALFSIVFIRHQLPFAWLTVLCIISVVWAW